LRALVQRVSKASVAVQGEVVGAIGRGLLALIGVALDDSESDASILAQKIAELRIFPDASGKFNLSVQDIQGEVLIVSQFTLYSDTRKGRRPSFIEAAPPDQAERLLDLLANEIRSRKLPVQTGRFRAYMQVELINDGPVTLMLDTAIWRK